MLVSVCVHAEDYVAYHASHLHHRACIVTMGVCLLLVSLSTQLGDYGLTRIVYGADKLEPSDRGQGTGIYMPPEALWWYVLFQQQKPNRPSQQAVRYFSVVAVARSINRIRSSSNATTDCVSCNNRYFFNQRINMNSKQQSTLDPELEAVLDDPARVDFQVSCLSTQKTQMDKLLP